MGFGDSAIPKKESAMILDVQYQRADKRNNTPDYLYVIWKDLDTNEKHVQVIPEPAMPIYFEKNEYRDHLYNKNYQYIDRCDKKVVKYKDIPFAIAEDMGDNGKRFLQNVFETKNYGALRNLYLYPYVYGADYSVESWYRVEWLRRLKNERPKKLKKGFADIEVDGYEVSGMPHPEDCPVNAITLIDDSTRTVYTFLLDHREYISKPIYKTDPEDVIKKEQERRTDYEHMYQEQDWVKEHIPEMEKILHEKFDDAFGEADYKLYFYKDERKMLVHFFELVHRLELDFLLFWNMRFDIPYLIKRLEILGLDPKEVICEDDFPVKICWFKEDKKHFDIKKQSDYFHCSSKTHYHCQMRLFAQERKAQSELRKFTLNAIAWEVLKNQKADYSEIGNLSKVPYRDFILFVIYNIKDVWLQQAIEAHEGDVDALYASSYENATPYEHVFMNTMTLRNVQYSSFLEQGLVPGENINIYNDMSGYKDEDEEDEEDEENEKEDDVGYEGALVADPLLNDYVGVKMYGRKTNNVFANGIDMDMSSFYPNTILGFNIDASTLIFKLILPMEQYDIPGSDGKLKLRGITSEAFLPTDDGAKEMIDNFQTRNYLSFGTKWLNLPTVEDVIRELEGTA